MKTKLDYENAKLEILLFSEADIITASGEGTSSGWRGDDERENIDEGAWT